MAVLKSLELNGNKQSFASWISNLSPCETPFASMIGKEGINQAQYSWQVDSLAPAIHNGFDEGSNVEFPNRKTTEVLNNYTSVLRKVVSVSNTTKAVATHGRNSEMNYQMGKAGKEIMRDLEHMLLHNLNGHPSLPNQASNFAGFVGLTAGLNVADTDTGAVVHKSIVISGNDFTRIDQKDIFDMTYNLFLSGSKADKIMFHPKHAHAFSSLIDDNAEEQLVYRMFDALDTTFNTYVNRIKDPLGRFYTLVPNRFMPEDKIYFFTESDWTQMILRSPSVSPLGDTGSSSRYLMEMEVGLRHRNPYASGVLDLSTVIVHNTFIPSRKVFTAAVNDHLDVRNDVTIDGVAEAGVEVTFHTSNPLVMTFRDAKGTTNSQGRVENVLYPGNSLGVVDVWTVCKGVRSEIHKLTVLTPNLDLIISNDNPVKDEVITLEAIITKAGGGVVGAGFEVHWYANPSENLELASVSTETGAGGLATVKAKVLKAEETRIYAVMASLAVDSGYIHYSPKAALFDEITIIPNTTAITGKLDARVRVYDDKGDPLAKAPINWSVSDTSIATLDEQTTNTDDDGFAMVKLTGASRGTANLYASANGVESIPTSFHIATGGTMEFTINPNPAKMNTPTTFTVRLTGEDGIALANNYVSFKTVPAMSPPLNPGISGADGVLVVVNSINVNSDFEVTALCEGFGLSQTIDLVVNA